MSGNCRDNLGRGYMQMKRLAGVPGGGCRTGVAKHIEPSNTCNLLFNPYVPRICEQIFSCSTVAHDPSSVSPSNCRCAALTSSNLFGEKPAVQLLKTTR